MAHLLNQVTATVFRERVESGCCALREGSSRFSERRWEAINLYSGDYPRIIASAGQLVSLARQTDSKTSKKDASITAITAMAYGWMPTIYGASNLSNFGHPEVDDIILKISSITTNQGALTLLDQCEERAPVAGSWIGTSKFLHFINPNNFPIWDTRVSIALGGPTSHAALNTKKNYLIYCEKVFETVPKAVAKKSVAEIKRRWGYSPTACRGIEFALFANALSNP